MNPLIDQPERSESDSIASTRDAAALESANPGDVILQGDHISRTYRMGRFDLNVLRGTSINVRRGEIVAITGASGSGKSTLLHILGGLDMPNAGKVNLDGDDLYTISRKKRERIRNRKVGFIFQFYHLLPELTVLENVMMPLMVSLPTIQWLWQRRDIRQKCEATLEHVGLKERLRHLPKELSGGEMQRVAIARAIVHRPLLLLADEPTGNLDREMGMGVLELLMSINAQGQTLVMVTHDPAVASHAHRRVHLIDGRLAEQGRDTLG